MAELAVPLLVVGAGAQIAGSFAAARGQEYAGEVSAQESLTAAAVADYNAKVKEREAQAIEQKSRFESQRQASAAARTMSALEAKLGASGGATTSGVPLLLLAEQQSESDLENLMIGYEGRVEASRARSEAGLESYQADVLRQRAKNQRKAGKLAGRSTLITGLGGGISSLGTALAVD